MEGDMNVDEGMLGERLLFWLGFPNDCESCNRTLEILVSLPERTIYVTIDCRNSEDRATYLEVSTPKTLGTY